MSDALTTGDCAELFNQAIGLGKAYTSRYFWGEIVDGRLAARLRVKGTRDRARIRVHPDDLLSYCRVHHEKLTPQILQLISERRPSNVPREIVR